MRMLWFYGLVTVIACTGCDATRTSPNAKDLNQATGTSASTTDQPAVDNSAINARDRGGDTKTPFDQSDDPADREKTAKIRQRVVDLPEMSINAQNVKIITAGGKVTLRGPVNSADERNAIEQIAKDVAGAEHVDNQIEITPK